MIVCTIINVIMTQVFRSRLHHPLRFCGKFAFFALLLLNGPQFLSAASPDAPAARAEKSGPRPERTLFIRAARVYIGTPYLRGGTTADGMDCSGLVYRAALDATGEPLARTTASLAAASERIPDSSREPGDLLFFNTTGRISHVGIYLGGSTFVHAASDGPRTGVIISDLSEDYWKRTYRFAGRVLPPEGLDLPPSGDIPAPIMHPFPFRGDVGFRINCTGGVLWDLMPGQFPARGFLLGAEATWAKNGDVWPGIGTGFGYDTRSGALSIPLTLSVTTASGFRFFAGTQFHLVAAASLDRTPRFPGLIGVSWNSKPAKIRGQNVSLYQSAEYAWFPDETFGDGFRFDTGLTFSFDI